MFWPYSGGTYSDDGDDDSDFYFDLPAGLLQMLCVAICIGGLNLGKTVINAFTVAKCLLVVFMICAGFAAWHENVFADAETFFPRGGGGTLKGTSLLFFGFIGFDEVCCLAGRASNPARLMPVAIAGTLIGAASLSCLAQVALGGMVGTDGFGKDDKEDDDDSGAGSTSFEEAFKDRGMPTVSAITAIGEVLLLPLVVLVSFLPQPELFAAMAEDSLVPGFFMRKNQSGTLVYGTLVSGAMMTVFSLCVPFEVLWDMINLGVLLGFNLTNTSLLLLRYGISDDSSHAPSPMGKSKTTSGSGKGSLATPEGSDQTITSPMRQSLLSEAEGENEKAKNSRMVDFTAHSSRGETAVEQNGPLVAKPSTMVIEGGINENMFSDAENREVAKHIGILVGGLWLGAAFAAYGLWAGFINAALNQGGDDDTDDGDGSGKARSSVVLTVFGFIGLAAYVVCLYILAFRRTLVVEAADASRPFDVFQAPAVPFTPAMAILFNFFLMAQYDIKTHGYLGGLIILALAGYAWHRSHALVPGISGYSSGHGSHPV